MHRSSRIRARRAALGLATLMALGLTACGGGAATVDEIGFDALEDGPVAAPRDSGASRGSDRDGAPKPFQSTTPTPAPTTAPPAEPVPGPAPAPAEPAAPVPDPAPAAAEPREPETDSQPESAERDAVPPSPRPPAPATKAPAPPAGSSAPVTPQEPAATDPARSGRASAANTGVKEGVSLAAASGGELSQDGLVLQNAVIRGDVTLTGDNQVLRNVRVEGQVRVTGTGTTITDSEMGALIVSGAKKFSASRLEVFGKLGKDGLHVTSDSGRATDVRIEDSWIHSPKVTPTAHYDGIQVRGVDGLVLRGNAFELGPHVPQFNAAVFLENANGGNADVTITDNYIDGGGFSVYLGGQNTTFMNNSFGRNARWGLLYPRSNMSSVTTGGNVWADTGEPVSDFD